MIVFALAVAGATLGAGIAAALAVGRLPSLRLRLAGLALLGVLLPLAAAAGPAWLAWRAVRRRQREAVLD